MDTPTCQTLKITSLVLSFSRQWPWLRLAVWEETGNQATVFSGFPSQGTCIRFSKWRLSGAALTSPNADAARYTSSNTPGRARRWIR